MSQHILMAKDWLVHSEIYTREQLEQNYHNALADFDVSTSNYADFAAVNAASAAYDAVPAAVEYFLNEYFELTGENRQDYIDAVNRGKHT